VLGDEEGFWAESSEGMTGMMGAWMLSWAGLEVREEEVEAGRKKFERTSWQVEMLARATKSAISNGMGICISRVVEWLQTWD